MIPGLNPTPTFKCDSPGMWRSLLDGERRFDWRKVDVEDRRFVALFTSPIIRFFYTSEQPISVEREAVFQLIGMQREPWAPGWVFILLGDRIA